MLVVRPLVAPGRRGAGWSGADRRHGAGSSFGDPEPVWRSACTAARRSVRVRVSLSRSPEHRLVQLGLGSGASSAAGSRPRAPSRRSASFAFMPPYSASQRCQVDSATWRWRQTSSSSEPPAKSLLPSASLRMIWSGVCRRRAAIDEVLLRSSLGHRTRTSSGPLPGAHSSSSRNERWGSA